MRIESRGSVLARLHKSDPKLNDVDKVYKDIEDARAPTETSPAEADRLRTNALYHGLARAARLGARLNEQFVSPVDKEYIKQEFSFLKERLLRLAAPNDAGEVVRVAIAGDTSNFEKSTNQAVYEFEKLVQGAFHGALKSLGITGDQGNGSSLPDHFGELIQMVAPANFLDRAQKTVGSILDMVEALPRLAEETATGKSEGLAPKDWVEQAVEAASLSIIHQGSAALSTHSLGLADIGLFLLS